MVLFLMILNRDNRGITFLSLLESTQRCFQFLRTESCSRNGIHVGIPLLQRQQYCIHVLLSTTSWPQCIKENGAEWYHFIGLFS